VTVGCKIYIRRPGPSGDIEERLAEILSIRDKPVNPYAKRNRASTDETGSSKPEDQWEYFVHWEAFNKRLDEWVSGSRLVLTRDLEWPRAKTSVGKKVTPVKIPGKALRVDLVFVFSALPLRRLCLRVEVKNCLVPALPAQGAL